MTSILSETFAPPSTATNGRSGELEGAAEVLQLVFHQEARGRLRQQLRHALGGRVRAVARPERVVHVQVGEIRELLRERRVVLLLFLVEADVLEHDEVVALGARRGDRLHGRLADAVLGEGHLALQQRRQVIGHRLQAELGARPALRPPEVRREDHRRAVLQRVRDGGQRRPHPRVVLDAPLLDRDVEVDADEDALAGEIEIADGQLRHGRYLWNEGGDVGQTWVLASASTEQEPAEAGSHDSCDGSQRTELAPSA